MSSLGGKAPLSGHSSLRFVDGRCHRRTVPGTALAAALNYKRSLDAQDCRMREVPQGRGGEVRGGRRDGLDADSQ